jgi:hypothetical protein
MLPPAAAILCTLCTGASSVGRFALLQDATGSWTIVSPNGKPTFIVALNHLASPFYYETIEGANGLSPCREYDVHCHDHDLFHTKYQGDWSAATADFISKSSSWGFNSAGYEYVPSSTNPWPYFPDLFITNASHIFQKAGLASFPDVFSDDFNTSTDARVAAWVATDQHINEPRSLQETVGWYFEDQPLWGDFSARKQQREHQNQRRPTDWAEAMRQCEPSAPGKAAYVQWLAGHYNNNTLGLETARAIYNIPGRC